MVSNVAGIADVRKKGVREEVVKALVEAAVGEGREAQLSSTGADEEEEEKEEEAESEKGIELCGADCSSF